jgi:hypothetical protein
MRKQERDLVLDFLTLAIAIFCLSAGVTVFATVFKSHEVFDRVFGQLFGYSIFSIGIFYALFQAIKYLLSRKFSMSDWSSGALWFPTIISGTILFTYFAFDSYFFGNFEASLNLSIAILIPAAIFRLSVVFAISFWEGRKRTPLSIVK